MHWAVAEDFTDVIVSKHMIYDHMPDAVMAALDQAAHLMGVGKLSTTSRRRRDVVESSAIIPTKRPTQAHLLLQTPA